MLNSPPMYCPPGVVRLAFCEWSWRTPFLATGRYTPQPMNPKFLPACCHAFLQGSR